VPSNSPLRPFPPSPLPPPSRAAGAATALLLLGAALHAQAPPTAPAAPQLSEDRRAGAASVSTEDCSKWLHTLASPEFEGRGTGQPGFQKAADYVAAHFKALGLEPRGDDGTYFQHVPWSAPRVDAEATFVAFRKDGAEVLRIPAARLRGQASTSLAAEGDVVLLAVEPPVLERGQRRMPEIPGLADVDVAGKVVVVFLKETAEGGRAGVARFAVQGALAGKSPAAVLFAQREAVDGSITGRGGAGRRAGNAAIAGMNRLPADVTFGGDDLTAMLAAGGADAKALDGAQAAVPIALQAKVAVSMREDKAPAMNVVGVLPGSDPKRKDEYVVIGSHLDHLGRSRGVVHPGADDDGSGSTGVLAVSRMFAENRVRPARSILFVCFCGEEVGLIGSEFFVRNCPVPLGSIVAELQMDMIGRNEEEAYDGPRLINKGEKAADNTNCVHLVGSQKLSKDLHELCLATNERAGFDLEYDHEDMFSRSDHANFARQGVPIVFFFTGLHMDYHRPSDTPDKIDYAKLLRIATWVYDLAFELATREQRPLVDAGLWESFRGKAAPPPAAPLRGARNAPEYTGPGDSIR
jgi:hypothetical protein